MTTSTPKDGGPRLTRIASHAASLEELVGAHPESLRSIFSKNAAADPSELGDAPRGMLLGLEPLVGVHLATRPIVRAIARTPIWTGVEFDHGGNAGSNRVLGGRALRFRGAVAPSELDGRPAFVLRYDKSPWPFSLLRDELRAAGPGLALGAFFARAGGGHTLLGWFGLEKT